MKIITELDKNNPIYIDSNRRDFQFNSMYYDPITDTMYDLHNGMRDLENKTLNFVGDAKKRIEEDPLRILRAFRFAFRFDLTVSDSTLMIIDEVKDLIKDVSKERIIDELYKSSDKMDAFTFRSYMGVMYTYGCLYFMEDHISIDELVGENRFAKTVDFEDKVLNYLALIPKEVLKDLPITKDAINAISVCQGINSEILNDDYLYFENIFCSRYKKLIIDFLRFNKKKDDVETLINLNKKETKLFKFKDLKKEINGKYIMEKYGISSGKEVGELIRKEIKEMIQGE